MKSNTVISGLMIIYLILTGLSCSGAGSPQEDGLQYIPAGNYNIFISMKVSKFMRSQFSENMAATIGRDLYRRELEKYEQTVGTNIEDIDQLLLVAGLPGWVSGEYVPDILLYCSGSFDDEGLKATFRTNLNLDEFERGEEAGHEYWRSKYTFLVSSGYNYAFVNTGNGYIAGTDRRVRDSLQILAGKGRKLTDNDKFRKSYLLLDEESELQVLFWDVTSQFISALQMTAQANMGIGDRAIIDSFRELSAIGISVDIDGKGKILARMSFESEISAAIIETYIAIKLRELHTTIETSERLIQPGLLGGKTANSMEIIKSIEVSRSSNIVQIVIPDASPLHSIVAGSMNNAFDRVRQTTTVEHLQKLGQCVEEYIMDFNRIGAPKTNDLEELRKLFSELEYNENDSMYKDGWGNSFIYTYEPGIGNKSYKIVSYGADSKPGPEPANPGIVKRFNEDIIFGDGRWIQRPEGAQR